MERKIIAVLLTMAMILPSVLSGCAAADPVIAPTVTDETASTEITTVVTSPETTEPVTAPSTEPATAPVEPELGISDVQQNSINVLNYLAFVTEEIYTSKDNRIILEDIYTSLMNDINPGVVDDITQDHLSNLRDVIENFLHVGTKRERLQYQYNQEKAASIRSAVPDPIAILSTVKSLNWKQLVVSVAFTVIDSYNNYKKASENADLEFLLSGWELDDEERETIRQNRKYAFDYMVDIVQEYGTDEFTKKELGILTLNEKAVKNFTEICATDEVYRRTQLLESAESTYKHFGKYWLELADCYFEIAEYQKCLDCVAKYNELATGIYRQDFILVQILPKAIFAAQEVYDGAEYVCYAQEYADAIIVNTSESDWSMRYFAAQVYIDLYSRTSDETYLWTAFEIAKSNVSQLIDEQCELNRTYLNEVEPMTIKEPDYKLFSEEKQKELKKEYKAEKKRVDAFNKELQRMRKTELPPVYEPLVLNCDLLFALAKQLNVGESEQNKIQKMLKTEDNGVFLSRLVNDRYSFDSSAADYAVEFSKDEIVIPANLLVQDAKVIVTVEDASGTTSFEDYNVTKVTRQDDDIGSFYAYYTSKAIKSVEWAAGTKVIVQICQGEEYAPITLGFEVTEYKDNFVIPDKVVFEAV